MGCYKFYRSKIPGLNFINVLRTAFTQADPESVKFQLSRQHLFTLLGSASIKAAGRTLMKLTPGLLDKQVQTSLEINVRQSCIHY